MLKTFMISLSWMTLSNKAKLSVEDAKNTIPNLHKRYKAGEVKDLPDNLIDAVMFYDELLDKFIGKPKN